MKTNKKDKEIKEERIQDKLNTYRKELGKENLKDLTLDELENFVRSNFNNSANRSGFYNQVSIINEILEQNNSLIKVDSAKLVNSCVTFDETKYFTKAELTDICDLLTNAQDKFILYALFTGIMGKNCDDLLSIKTEDVASDYSYIRVKGEVVFADDNLKKYIKDTMEEEVYVRENNKYGITYEDLNMNNPYLIKPIPSTKNDDGINKMSKAALNGRLSKLNSLLLNQKIVVTLNPTALYYSGIMFKMFVKEIEDNIEWSIPILDDYLKMNSIPVNAIELYRKYYNKYHGSNSLREA